MATSGDNFAEYFTLAQAEALTDRESYIVDLRYGLVNGEPHTLATDEGLQVPVVHHAEDLSLVGLARALHRIIPAARENRLTIGDIQGGTITVTNPGPFGTVRSAPIIPPGQSAILSVDSVREIPVASGGALAIRSVAILGLTYDARLCDERDAAPFLTTLQAWLEGGFIPETRRQFAPHCV